MSDTVQAREAIRLAIVEGFKPYQEELEAILARAKKFEQDYLFHTDKDAETFLALRQAAIHEGAAQMQEALTLHPDCLTEAERQPKNPEDPMGYNKMFLLGDARHGFFSYAFVLGPHQETPPHSHPGLCASLSLESGAMETLFVEDGEGKMRPSGVRGRAQGEIGAAIGPQQGIDLHVIHNPDPVRNLVLVHLYDGWNITRIGEGVVFSQFETRQVPNGVDRVYSDIPGRYPAREGKVNPGEHKLVRWDAESNRGESSWVERTRENGSPESGQTP